MLLKGGLDEALKILRDANMPHKLQTIGLGTMDIAGVFQMASVKL